MRQSSRGFLKEALSVLLVFVLAMSSALMPGLASASSADLAVADAESAVQSSKLSLAEAQAELNRIESECKALNQEITDMQTQIDELAQEVLEAQQRMLEGREALGNAARHEYKTNSTSTFISILLGSTSFQDLTQNVQYISQIMDHQANEVSEQQRLRDELDKAATALNDQKNEQEAKLNSLESKQVEAQRVVERASSELESNTEKLDALKKQAAAIKQQAAQQAASQTQDSQATQGSSESSSSASSGTSQGSSSSSGSSSASGSGWKTGVASAYGGSTDPSTPGTITANGSTVSDWSMGVAIPMSWPNYRSYFGRTVEIVYNGRTVYATVNDCGYMGGGSRSLDLQPGVFKAFGFQSCMSWGVRTVQYRFL